MPSKTTAKASAKSPRHLTDAQVKRIAQMRREGATWRDVYSYMGRRSTSTKLRAKLEAAGFDRFGRKGGKGKSMARGYGAKDEPGVTPIKTERAPRKAKATTRKRGASK